MLIQCNRANNQLPSEYENVPEDVQIFFLYKLEKVNRFFAIPAFLEFISDFVNKSLELNYALIHQSTIAFTKRVLYIRYATLNIVHRFLMIFNEPRSHINL